MSLEDYRNATLRTLYNAMTQYGEHLEERQRDEWERMRFSTTHLLNIHLDKKNKITATELLPLPWDSESPQTGAKAMTYEEQKAAFEKLDEYMKNRKKQGNGDR